MLNHLATQSSPYLLQHADNPVDWYPWCEEAFEKARNEEKPIFLSIGYSACHWCHVMERESFEDEETAEIMNRNFISIKVDREERPDIDAIYMSALQALTGNGGWPMSVFLTPDATPFFGGTYFPNRSVFGLVSFREVLLQIADLWKTRRNDVVSAGRELTEHIREMSNNGTGSPKADTLDMTALERAIDYLSDMFDEVNGGWGSAPKFPQPSVLEFLLRRYCSTRSGRCLNMVTRTLDSMLRGGIYDQIGGGFHRYATDPQWLVPHFEKMLYDNAQLAGLYLHAWQVTKNEAYRLVATQTLDYMAREMLDSQGGFFSAQDADSDGVEDAFYVWDFAEIAAVLKDDPHVNSEDIDLFKYAYGVTEEGNFEGKNILHIAHTVSEIARAQGYDRDETENRLMRMRTKLFEIRSKRRAPMRDDKVLASWNGLTLAAFAEAARVFSRDDYLRIAERNASFLLLQMRNTEGRIRRSWKDGAANLNGYLEDYSHCADGLIELYQTTFDPRWFFAAKELMEEIIEHFKDSSGGFYDTSDDHESLIVRPKDVSDNVIPSGGSMAAKVLLQLYGYTADSRFADEAQTTLLNMQSIASRSPLGHAHWLSVLERAIVGQEELAIIGSGRERDAMLDAAHRDYHPNLIIAACETGEDVGVPLLVGRETLNSHATAYVCRMFSCDRPITDPRDLYTRLHGGAVNV